MSSRAKVGKQKNIGTNRSLMSRIIRDRQLYLILIPFLLYYIIFVYKPMGGILIAFKDYSVYKGIADSPWVGLKYFEQFFNGEYFVRLLRNTSLISLYTIIFSFPAPLILALLLNEVRHAKFKSAIQTCTYLPHFISAVVIAGLVTNFLAPSNGLINNIIRMFGGESIYFLTKPEYFRTIYILMNIWTEVGYGSIVYIAAISAIDMQLYEACEIDGGNRFTKMWHVTLPGILPTIVTLFIIAIGGFLNVGYEKIILLYQPATYETADIISTYVYRIGIEQANYSMSTAVNLFNSVIGFILVSMANYISNKVNDTGLW